MSQIKQTLPSIITHIPSILCCVNLAWVSIRIKALEFLAVFIFKIICILLL